MSKSKKERALAARQTELQDLDKAIKSGDKETRSVALKRLQQLSKKDVDARLALLKLCLFGYLKYTFSERDVNFLNEQIRSKGHPERQGAAAYLQACLKGVISPSNLLHDITQPNKKRFEVQETLRLLAIAGNAGHLNAKVMSARLQAWSLLRFEEADAVLEPLTDEAAGFTAAYTVRALIHLYGQLPEPKIPDAISWLQTAAEKQNPEALFVLGQLYTTGVEHHLKQSLSAAGALHRHLSAMNPRLAADLAETIRAVSTQRAAAVNRLAVVQHEASLRMLDERAARAGILPLSEDRKRQITSDVEEIAKRLSPAPPAPEAIGGRAAQALPPPAPADPDMQEAAFAGQIESVPSTPSTRSRATLDEIPLADDDGNFIHSDSAEQPTPPPIIDGRSPVHSTSPQPRPDSEGPQPSPVANKDNAGSHWGRMLKSLGFWMGIAGLVIGIALAVSVVVSLLPVALATVAVAVGIGGGFLAMRSYKDSKSVKLESPSASAVRQSGDESDTDDEVASHFTPSYVAERRRLAEARVEQMEELSQSVDSALRARR
ncbi:MAG: hypothetical protein CMF48_02835 [Legionellales bacterium]|nr:hypothetical protein [Legionellales bacterium]